MKLCLKKQQHLLINKKMKKLVIILTGLGVLALAAGVVWYVMRDTETARVPVSMLTDSASVSIEWYEITPQNYSTVHPIFNEIKPVFADSFLEVIRPYVYAKEPRLASHPMGKSSFVDGKVNFGIRDTMKRRLNKQLSQVVRDVQSKKIAAAYVAVARDTARNVVGFALFEECVLSDYLSGQLKNIIEGAVVPSTKRDQLCVLYLAVAPEAQKKRIGKKLLFFAFDHCSHIKNIYLTTSADEFNKNAQDFFEHIGFKRMLKGEFTPDYNDAGFDKIKIVYGYTKA